MPDQSKLSIPVLLGTSRVGCRSAGVARTLLRALIDRGGTRAELIDLAALDLPVMHHRLGDTESPPAGAVELSMKLTGAAGLLIVAPEYKNGYPGALKNAIDYLEP